MSEQKSKRVHVGKGELKASPSKVSGRGTASAVKSVDRIAVYVVRNRHTATAIREAVCSLDMHDLTAVKNRTIPSHVHIPNGENSEELASSYAEAEISERQHRSSWWRSGIGWAMLIFGIAFGAVLTYLLSPN